MLQVAVEVCEGVRLHGIVTRKYLDQIAFPNLKKGFDKSGKPQSEWSNYQIGGGGFLCAAPNQDALAKAVDGLKSTIAFYGSARSSRSKFELDRQGDTAGPLHQTFVPQQTRCT